MIVDVWLQGGDNPRLTHRRRWLLKALISLGQMGWRWGSLVFFPSLGNCTVPLHVPGQYNGGTFAGARSA